MDFSLSKTEILFRQMIRDFAEKEVKPLAAEVDEEERFPIETVEKMAKLGIMGIPFPVEYGGAGGNNILYTMAVEELSKVCGTTGVVLSAHTSLLLFMNLVQKSSGKNICRNFVQGSGLELSD